jgi:hypothetical protein
MSLGVVWSFTHRSKRSSFSRADAEAEQRNYLLVKVCLTWTPESIVDAFDWLSLNFILLGTQGVEPLSLMASH